MKLQGRQELALDHSLSLCFIAGAGTGKTQVLVEKYVDLLDKVEGLHASNILALTFTQKAASEMKERVRESLAKRSFGRWRSIRDEFVWAEISTFHSFCAGVLRQFPTETGIEPNFTVLDELEYGQLLEEALDILLHSTDPSTESAITRLLRDVDSWHVKEYIRELYDKRILSEDYFKKLESKDDDAVIDDWKSYFLGPQEELASLYMSNGDVSHAIAELRLLSEQYAGDDDSGMKYLRKAEQYLADLQQAESCEAIFSILAGLSSIEGGKRNMGSAKNWEKSDLESLRKSYLILKSFLGIAEPLLDLKGDDEAFLRYTLSFLRDLRTAFNGYIEIAEELKRQRGAIDFNDMITATYRLFRDHKEIVLSHFQNKFRYILVDEFQDTDPIQCKILWMILGDLSIKSEKLFVVGDPKQSIYLFRNADVTLFKETQKIIEEGLKGKSVPLDINFRSTSEIIRFVNYLFSRLFSECSKPWEFNYDSIEVSDYRQKDSGSVEILLLKPSEEGEQEPQAEAEMVARRIQNLIEIEKKLVYWDEEGNRLPQPRPAQYRDVTVLLQRRTNLHYFEWALQRYGIPYYVSGGLGFFEQQEIIDIFNLLRFLNNELDDVALYGLLRSPYFGISDTELYRITKSGSGSLWWRLQQYLDRYKDSNLEKTVQLLKEWLELSQREPIAGLLRRIVRDSGIYAVYGGMENGNRLQSNLEKFLQMARSTQAHGFTSLSSFVAELKILIDEVPMEGEAQVDMETGNTVKIMTVHASKGLQFPVVLIPDMGGKGKDDYPGLMVDETYGIGLSVPDPASDYELKDTFFKRLLKHNHSEKIKSERKRLFYVATTRAKDHLIICGSRPEEFPLPIEEGKTWLDWTGACLDLFQDKIDEGLIKIEWPDGSSKSVSIRIIQDPASIQAEIKEKIRYLIEVPENFKQSDLPESLRPLSVDDQEHIFSVSEIESYIQCPQEYYYKYKIGRLDRDITSSAIGENAVTKGLMIHEIFQGKDPTMVLRSYGISDRYKVGSYEALYKRFISSDLMSSVVEEYKELPFLVKINGIPFTGKIDRLVKKGDGSWSIIDYKTTEISKDEVSERARHYILQLFVYRNAMKMLLGQDVHSFVYFTSLGDFAEVTGDDEKISEDIKRIADMIDSEQFSFADCGNCSHKYAKHNLEEFCPALGSNLMFLRGNAI